MLQDVFNSDLLPGDVLLGGVEIVSVKPTLSSDVVEVMYRWPDGDLRIHHWPAYGMRVIFTRLG